VALVHAAILDALGIKMGCFKNKNGLHWQLSRIWYTPVISETYGRAALLVNACKTTGVEKLIYFFIIFISSQRA